MCVCVCVFASPLWFIRGRAAYRSIFSSDEIRELQNIDELLRSRYGETSLDSGGASGAVTGAHQSYTLLFGDNADEAPMCQQGDVSSEVVVHENTEKCNDPKRSNSKKHQNKKSRGKETGDDEDALIIP